MNSTHPIPSELTISQSCLKPATTHHSHVGRKGDPRMHQAVACRLADESLSLTEALIRGGFDYPTGTVDTTQLDSEGITLAQRKNQLSRRLRMERLRIQKQGGKQRKQEAQYHLETRSTPPPPPSLTKEISDVMAVFLEELEEREEQEKEAAINDSTQPQIQATFGSDPSTKKIPNPPSVRRDTLESSSTSGQALNSLMKTASSAGMTLEQLAVVLQNNDNLNKLDVAPSNRTASSDSTSAAQQSSQTQPPAIKKSSTELALGFYTNEVKDLYKKVLLQAGVNPEQAQEGSHCYLKFAWEAWQQEGKRLQQLLLEQTLSESRRKAEQEKQQQNGPEELKKRPYETGNELYEAQDQQQQAPAPHLYQDSLSPARGYSHQRPSSPSTCQYYHKQAKTCQGLRHVHRLGGQCGHRAVLHQPPGGTAHIDFVVGDTVECFQDVPTSSSGLWPSQFSCKEVGYENNGSDDCCTNATTTPMPKRYPVDEVNWDGNEWIPDFSNEESSSLLGLFRLQGDSPSMMGVVEDGVSNNMASEDAYNPAKPQM